MDAVLRLGFQAARELVRCAVQSGCALHAHSGPSSAPRRVQDESTPHQRNACRQLHIGQAPYITLPHAIVRRSCVLTRRSTCFADDTSINTPRASLPGIARWLPAARTRPCCREWPEGAAVVVDGRDWSIIPAENLVATCQGRGGSALLYAATAEDARTLLTALEVGVDGVVLRTDSVAEVRRAASPRSARGVLVRHHPRQACVLRGARCARGAACAGAGAARFACAGPPLARSSTWKLLVPDRSSRRRGRIHVLTSFWSGKLVAPLLSTYKSMFDPQIGATAVHMSAPGWGPSRGVWLAATGARCLA